MRYLNETAVARHLKRHGVSMPDDRLHETVNIVDHVVTWISALQSDEPVQDWDYVIGDPNGIDDYAGVPHSRVLFLAGPSGSGKTTTLQALCDSGRLDGVYLLDADDFGFRCGISNPVWYIDWEMLSAFVQGKLSSYRAVVISGTSDNLHEIPLEYTVHACIAPFALYSRIQAFRAKALAQSDPIWALKYALRSRFTLPEYKRYLVSFYRTRDLLTRVTDVAVTIAADTVDYNAVTITTSYGRFKMPNNHNSATDF